MRRIENSDVGLLAKLASRLRSEYVNESEEDAWRDSPFAWIKERPSRQVGKIGEQLIAGFFAAKGLEVVKSGDAEADRVINGKRVEIKFSTLWKNGTYTFQQIRDQNYEFVVCLGISPFSAHCWVVPKKEIRAHAIGQHTGRGARDTLWLTIDPAAVPRWISRWGGSLQEAVDILR